MSVWRRLAIAGKVWIAIAAVAILYYQVFQQWMKPLAADYSGPFDPVIGHVDTVVPIALVTIGTGITVWVMVASAQEERARRGTIR